MHYNASGDGLWCTMWVVIDHTSFNMSDTPKPHPSTGTDIQRPHRSTGTDRSHAPVLGLTQRGHTSFSLTTTQWPCILHWARTPEATPLSLGLTKATPLLWDCQKPHLLYETDTHRPHLLHWEYLRPGLISWDSKYKEDRKKQKEAAKENSFGNVSKHEHREKKVCVCVRAYRYKYAYRSAPKFSPDKCCFRVTQLYCNFIKTPVHRFKSLLPSQV